jgi:hypothetical protein
MRPSLELVADVKLVRVILGSPTFSGRCAKAETMIADDDRRRLAFSRRRRSCSASRRMNGAI